MHTAGYSFACDHYHAGEISSELHVHHRAFELVVAAGFEAHSLSFSLMGSLTVRKGLGLGRLLSCSCSGEEALMYSYCSNLASYREFEAFVQLEVSFNEYNRQHLEHHEMSASLSFRIQASHGGDVEPLDPSSQAKRHAFQVANWM